MYKESLFASQDLAFAEFDILYDQGFLFFAFDLFDPFKSQQHS